MDRTEVYELIDKELEEGKTIEEIYVEYDSLFTEKLEKPIEEKTVEDRKKEDEYLEIRDLAATYIAHNALKEKGYIRVGYKKFGRWEKVKEEE